MSSRQTVIELAKDDPRIVAITAAMPGGTSLGKFQKAYPDRFYDVGIAEQHAVTFAAGLAAEGLRPVVGIYSTFLQRAYDQIIHDVCLQDCRSSSLSTGPASPATTAAPITASSISPTCAACRT